MSVLKRKMFGGGYAHRGTGITSGLVPHYEHGGYHAGDEVRPLYEEYFKIMKDIKTPSKPFDRFQANVPALLALSSGLMSGKSLQGGWGGAFDILGQSLGAATPLFAEAAKQKQAYKQQQVQSEDAMKLKALDMAYDDLAAQRKSTKDFSSKKYEVKIKGDETGETKVVTEFFNKSDPTQTYYMLEGKAIKADTFDILGTLGAYDTSKKQNFVEQDYQVTLNDDSQVTLTKITDKTTDAPGKWYDANGVAFNSEDIKSIQGTVGTASTSTGPKKRTPTTDTYYASNPKWKEGDDITDKYFQLATKIDEDNNITVKDPNTKQYISEDEFTTRYGTVPVSDQPLDWKPRIEAGIEVAGDTKDDIKAKKVYSDRFKILYPEYEDLTEADLDYLLTAFPPGSDFIKSFMTGQTNELDQELYNIKKRIDANKKVALNESQSTVSASGVPKDAIDMYYNLDPDSPDYATRKPFFVQKYNQTPMISAADIKAITGSLENLKDLSIIEKRVDEAIPVIGKPAAWFAETFGINLGLAEFMTGKRGLEASAIEQLVSGVPSNFDAKRIIDTIPQEGLSPATNRIRIKRLKQIFGDIILNNIKFNIQLGKRVPADMIMLAKEIGDPKKIDMILRGEVDQEKVTYMNNIAAAVPGFDKAGYIDKFGDPLSRSLSLLAATDTSLNTPLSEQEKETLKERILNLPKLITGKD